MFGKDQADRVIPTALAGLAMRQRVISENVANVSTPGYKAAKVTFEESLRSAMDRSRSDPTGALSQLENLSPTVTRPQDATRRVDGNTVDIDKEMVDLAETNIRFNTLAQVAVARFRALHGVISDGRR
jgi:flagellar basal-body rod protein FlgB